MRKALLLFILITCYVSSSAQNIKKSGFTIDGEITGPHYGSVLLEYLSITGKIIKDKATIKNGKFHFKGIVSEPTIARLYGNINLSSNNDGNNTLFYLENSTLTVRIRMNHFKEIKIYGSKTQDEISTLLKKENELLDKTPPIEKEFNKISINISNEEDLNKLKILSRNATHLSSLLKSYSDSISMMELQFAKEKQHSFASVEYLFKQLDTLSVDTIIKIYNAFDSVIQHSSTGLNIKKDIIRKTASFKGSFAPNFKTTDVNNQEIELAKYRGQKYILLDFWASWCVYCRKEFPFLKRMYNNYSNKGLEIIGISVEEDSVLWKKAIYQDSVQLWKNILFTLINVHDTKKYISKEEQDFYDHYLIAEIPVMILIDKEGKVIERCIGQSEKNTAKIEAILKKVFE